MTLDEARKKIVDDISEGYEGNDAKNIAELLLEYVTKLPLTERIIKKSESLSVKQENLLIESITRLRSHEPIQYITNECWFAGMKFYVDQNVLIPRPETDELVDWIVADLKVAIGNRNKAIPKSEKRKLKIIDVGTGSGCIAIALKTKLPETEMWGCDVSDEALNVARINADALLAAVDFVPLNFLESEQRKQLPRIDVIISNPPYVPERDKSEMKRNVIEYEPPVALFVPNNDPLIFYDAIADFGNENLHKGVSIYVEIHEDLGDKVENLFRSKDYTSIELKKDLQGKDRMIRASHH
jgi:release factor glutamine methyltransferase